MREVVLAAIACGALVVACTVHSTRYVTPWLRLQGEYTPCLMAESGSKGCTWNVRTERKTRRGWEEFKSAGVPSAVCAKSRVATSRALIGSEGKIIGLDHCEVVAPAPDDRTFWCIEIARADAHSRAYEVLARNLDCNGNELSRITAPDPQPEPADARPFDYSTDLTFLGFVNDDPMFQSKMNPSEAASTCVAFALERSTKAWSRLGEMTPGNDALYKCRSTRDWGQQLHRPVIDTAQKLTFGD